ncbi:unnamed protein product [Staurois parvus]|uniref:Uncharacterized protein n=1 Tax=Staurois parvus TaxID=386267 RepID=A0ABN9DKL3_9NEOB|nr:unnamed protein product [Staurois parvus]
MIPYCPGGPMSRQSASAPSHCFCSLMRSKCLRGNNWPGVSRGPHKMPLVPFS